MIRFYAPDIEQTLTLPESDSQHAIRVLRKAVGDEIEVVDGQGRLYRCVIVDAHPKRTAVDIVERTDLPLPWSSHITLAVAPTKHLDRMEWLTEKATEIGVNRITPLLCRYSERRELKAERLRKIAVSAMKQSLKAQLPQVDEMTPLKALIEQTADVPQRFIAYCDPSIPRRLLAKEYRCGLDTVILIGPEGDFSPEEIKLALDSGFIPVSLGECRLRTETAALSAIDTCHVIEMANEKSNS